LEIATGVRRYRIAGNTSPCNHQSSTIWMRHRPGMPSIHIASASRRSGSSTVQTTAQIWI
jgi:hypothetical protein